MFRNLLFGGVVAVAACVHGSNVRAADDPHHEHFLKCAKVCADCQILCDMCFQHCAALVVKGDKNRDKTMQTCVDCADCCKLAATLSARMSPFAGAACECCAKCCDACAAACEKFPDDKHMAECANSCRDCAKECRAMMKHVAN